MQVNIIERVEKMTGLSWRQLVGRVVFGVAFTSWIGFLPTYLTIHYMVDMNFFSYDMFTDGVFGINSFGFVSGVLLVFMSFALFGFIPFAWASYLNRKNGRKENSDRWMAWVFIALAVLFHLFLFFTSLYKGKLFVYGIFSVLGLFVCGFCCLLIGKNFKDKLLSWVPSAIFIFASAMFPFVSQDANSQFVSLALKTFRIGGMLDVVAVSKNGLQEITRGKLILQTPDNLYIESEKEGLITIPYASDILVKVKS